MKLHVMGPNLVGSDETFHVHAAGCADVQRSAMYRGPDHASDRKASYPFDSLAEVVEFVYADMIDEDDSLTIDSLYNDFRVFPCAASLPTETPES